MERVHLASEWAQTLAPGTGDVRAQLVREAAEFLGVTVDEAWQRLEGAPERFKDEWIQSRIDISDPEMVARFYNQSDAELFELINWHASDPIHYRTLIVRDYALESPGRACLDYGSGIGNDAIVFGEAGYSVTLADISDILLAFAEFRCRRRRIPTRTIDLKRVSLPSNAFDVILCFDVLEHIPAPIDTVREMRQALGPDGLFVMHAPFGDDPEHPMHVVHEDVVTPRMRSLGFRPVDREFPEFVRAPLLYRRREMAWLDRAGYYLYDGHLRHNAVADWLASCYRRFRTDGDGGGKLFLKSGKTVVNGRGSANG